MNRGDTTELLQATVPELLDIDLLPAAGAEAIRLQAALKVSYPTRHSASVQQLEEMVEQAADLHQSLYKDWARYEDTAELIALAASQRLARHQLKTQRAEGMVQLPLFRQRRRPEDV